MYKHPITTTRLSPAKIRSALITSPLLRTDEEKDAPHSSAFITDACQATLFLAALLVAAARGMFHTVTLQELSLQGSGWGYWLDVISGNCILLYYVAMIYGILFQNKVDRRLTGIILPGLMFSILASYYHAMLDERGEYPHWFFAQAFLVLGSISLYWFTDNFGKVAGGEDPQLIRSTKTRFAFLPLVPLILLSMFPPDEVSNTLNMFVYNGWVFIYVAHAIDPPLTLANKVTGIEEFGWCRYAFPILSSVFFLEDYVVRVLRIDPHIVAHVLVMAFVCTTINGIEKAYQLEKKG